MPLFRGPLFNMVTGEGSGFYDYECRLLEDQQLMCHAVIIGHGAQGIYCVLGKKNIF